MSNAEVTLANIIDRIPNTYNINERWVVKKMRLEYVHRIATILPIIYKKNKVQYFCNKFAMMIFKKDQGKIVNWATIIYSQLVKKLIRWEKCQKNMIEGITKTKTKKGCMPFYYCPKSYVSDVVSIRRSKTTKEEEKVD
jgi:hypothetical protein